ncbi:MAG: DegT/DnrJ/EryC1/StrS family aminotransferase [Myxococcota bacterium]
MPHRAEPSPKTSSGRPAVAGGNPAFQQPILVTRPVAPNPERYAEISAEIFASQWMTNDGPTTRRLEQQLQEHLEVAFCATFSSGTAALLIALRGLDLSGEVITTPFTFPATPHCIEWNGLKPVFCDIDPHTYNLDVEQISARITPQTSAIVPVHVFGNPCDVIGIQEIADRHGLKVIYDAAHAFGVRAMGRPIGVWGDLSIFSFHATKIFHTVEGGAIVANSRDHLESLTLLRNFGIVNENEVRGIGLNGKLSELHAAVGLLVLTEIDREIDSRARLTRHYRERLQEIEGIRFQKSADGARGNYFSLALEFSESEFGLSRDQVCEGLRAENIFARKRFYPLCSENDCYSHLPSACSEGLPNARRLSENILTLPLYGALTINQVDGVIDALLRLRSNAASVRQALA